MIIHSHRGSQLGSLNGATAPAREATDMTLPIRKGKLAIIRFHYNTLLSSSSLVRWPMPIQNASSTDQPHLVSLVLQSKKALQHGEQVCSRAHASYNASAQEAVEVLALDAKVRWVTDALLEQLKVHSAPNQLCTSCLTILAVSCWCGQMYRRETQHSCQDGPSTSAQSSDPLAGSDN